MPTVYKEVPDEDGLALQSSSEDVGFRRYFLQNDIARQRSVRETIVLLTKDLGREICHTFVRSSTK